MADPTIVTYENGVIKGLKKGSTEIIFTIKDTDYSYKCVVNVTGGAGCSSTAASDLIALFSMLAIAMGLGLKRKH